MRFYPINLSIKGKRVVIVGGGAVAYRKCLTLLDAGAAVTVVSPELCAELACLANSSRIDWSSRHYREGDLKGAFLAFATTDNSETNRAVVRHAHQKGILINVADASDPGDFTVPASIATGDLLVTVSTGGTCPAFSRWLREDLQNRIGPEHAKALALLVKVREKLLTEGGDTAYNKRLLSELANSNLPELFKNDRREEIEAIVRHITGLAFSPELLQ